MVKVLFDKKELGQIKAYVDDYIQKPITGKKLKRPEEYKLILFILVDTGARITEVLNLRWENVNEKNKEIVFEREKKRKGQVKTRVAKITQDTAKELYEYRMKVFPKPEEKLFTVSRIAVFNFLKNYGEFLAKATGNLKFRKLHPHSLRASFIMLLLKELKDIHKVKVIVGHEKITTTERYLSLRDDVILEKNPLEG